MSPGPVLTRADPVSGSNATDPAGSCGGGLLGEHVAAARARAFVGRAAERDAFRAALAGEAEARPVLFVHGPGGIGKSALLHRLSWDATAAGRTVVWVDGARTPADACGRLDAFRDVLDDPAPVLLVDSLERCTGLEAWLRESFLPDVPGDAVVVMASRTPPQLGWRTDPGWAACARSMKLPALSAEETNRVLGDQDVPPPLNVCVREFAGGNPLALSLVAAAARTGGEAGWSMDGGVSRRLTAVLFHRLVGGLPTEQHRRTLQVTARAGTVTEELLRAELGAGAAAQSFAWLRAQPWVTAVGCGLLLDEAVRNTVEHDARWNDPDGFTALHERLHDHLVEQIRTVPFDRALDAAAALHRLYRDITVLPPAHEWTARGSHEDEACRPVDEATVLGLIADCEGPESAENARFWLRHQPEAFRVRRPVPYGPPRACSAWLRLTAYEGETADPVVAAVWDHVRRHGPLRADERISVARFHAGSRERRDASSALALSLRCLVAETVRTGGPAWVFFVLRDDGVWDGALRRHGLLPTEHRWDVGGVPQRLFARDVRVFPASDWLRGLLRSVSGEGDGRDPCHRVNGAGLVRTDEARTPTGVLSEREFADAVHAGLRALRRPSELALNPLRRSRVAAVGGEDLAAVLQQAVYELAEEQGGHGPHQAAVTAFVEGTTTHRAAAERLGVSLSTYRRHLRTAVERVSARLWHEEVYASGVPDGYTSSVGDREQSRVDR
ncbi:AAA family ATPase [Streptomyces sp. PDY-4]|uniref:AAA family ATPase n=1 Tax=Streptomyces sp. PDY-4 TaxID=3376070 RepID=UPI0037BA7AB2